ncbi:hypothetical protein [Cellulomonas cellasea]|uniref:hypothetical protein n=1 Tax=Cellulomonas cellasea TaxID=43670 RepID=UPI0011445A7E|nr:hypothetical protein [Cellulomonas cellasea]
MTPAGPSPEPVDRRAWVLVVALVVVVVGLAAAVRTLGAPVRDPLTAAATSNARHGAQILDAGLVGALDDAGDGSPEALTAAFEEAFDRTPWIDTYEPVDPGGADAAWRVQIAGSASVGSGLFSEMAEAVLCVDVTVTRDADPPVRMVDSACLTEQIRRDDDRFVEIDLSE